MVCGLGIIISQSGQEWASGYLFTSTAALGVELLQSMSIWYRVMEWCYGLSMLHGGGV